MKQFKVDEDFINQQAKGALIKGTIIYKTNFEKGDLIPNGHRGKIIGSVFHPAVSIFNKPIEYGYFIQWDGFDKIGFVVDYKLKVEIN